MKRLRRRSLAFLLVLLVAPYILSGQTPVPTKEKTSPPPPTQATTYKISGTVKFSGAPVPNIVLSGLPGNPTTDRFGRYSASVEYDWTGTVTPTLPGVRFSRSREPTSMSEPISWDRTITSPRSMRPSVSTSTSFFLSEFRHRLLSGRSRPPLFGEPYRLPPSGNHRLLQEHRLPDHRWVREHGFFVPGHRGGRTGADDDYPHF